jgi:hypothetical protein
LDAASADEEVDQQMDNLSGSWLKIDGFLK